MKTLSEISLKTRTIPSELTYDIRKKVLWPHIKDGNYSISVDRNPDTFHLGTFIGKRLISIGTFIKENNPKFNCDLQYRLRAMATDKNYRVRGAGRSLFLKAIKILKIKKIKILWCDARIVAVPFYEILKMKSLGEAYEIVNIGPHKTMYIHLNKNK